MPDIRIALTDKAVAKLPLSAQGQYLARDTELPGFFVLIGKTKKTYTIQGDLRRDGLRKSVRLAVGQAGDLNAREARAKAKEWLGKIASGEHPTEERRRTGGATLGDAYRRYLEVHMVRKGRSAGTIANLKDHMERLLKDWQDTPLATLGRNPAMVAERHDKITRENGPYIANGTMRSLRAVYNHARKTNRDLPPENPVYGIDWNVERRRDTATGVEDLPRWFVELSTVSNPIRREFHLISLLSGSRPDALKKARWEHLDLRRRVLHIPKPKGGERKAFDVPLSRAMLRALWRARGAGRMMHPRQSAEWIFPGASAAGHMIEHWERRDVLFKWGNDLRQSYRTLAQHAGLSDLDAHLLMNHSLPGVNAGYITRGKLVDHLRGEQERLSGFIIASGLNTAAGKRLAA
jgi:integrase